MEFELVLEQVKPADLSADLLSALGADANDGQILRFKNAVLARAEVNKNKDDLTPEFLQGVADTLPMLPIDVEHDQRQLCGIYTAARFVPDPAKGNLPTLFTDGLIYMERYPEIAAGMMANPPTVFQSIEATGSQVQCSMCHRIFGMGDSFCNHLMAKHASGAVRKMIGKGKAKGGAVTRNPAGTDTTFDSAGIGVLASLEGEVKTVLTFLTEAEYTFFKHGVIAKALSGDERKKLPDSDFALIQDGNRRFPIGDCEHAALAIQLLPKAKDVSDSERAEVKRKAEAKLAACDHTHAKAGMAEVARAFGQAILEGIFDNNPHSGLPLRAPVYAPHYYIAPYPPVVERKNPTAAPDLQASLKTDLDSLTIQRDELQLKLQASEKVGGERAELIAALEQQVKDLEAKVASLSKAKPIGMTAITLGSKTPADKEPVRVLPQ